MKNVKRLAALYLLAALALTGCKKKISYEKDLTGVIPFDFTENMEDIIEYEESLGNMLEHREITNAGYLKMEFAGGEHRYLLRLDTGTLHNAIYPMERYEEFKTALGEPDKIYDKIDCLAWYGTVNQVECEVSYEEPYFRIFRVDGEEYREQFEAGKIIPVITEMDLEKEEILFNNLEWGCSLAEAETSGMLDFLQIAWDEIIDVEKPKSVSSVIYPDESADKCELGEEGGISHKAMYVRLLNRTGLEVEVAGYPIFEVDLHFAKDTKDGNLLSRKEDSIFYGAEYSFQGDFTVEMLEDLKNKLFTLYGPASETGTEDIVLDELEYYSWYGANDTVMVLSYYKGMKSVNLAYAWKKGDEYLKAADAIREKVNAANVKGL